MNCFEVDGWNWAVRSLTGLELTEEIAAIEWGDLHGRFRTYCGHSTGGKIGCKSSHSNRLI